MKTIVKEIINSKKAMPILSYPVKQIMNVSVKDMVSSSEIQAKAIEIIAEKFDVPAVFSSMDLSVEAECFGAKVRLSDNEPPEVLGGIISEISQVDEIIVPDLVGRTGIFLEAIKLAKSHVNVPIIAGCIGPYSLAARLFDMTELMCELYESPDEVKVLLDKTTEFIIKYIKALKEAGADGICIAEPAAGLLSPELADEFSNYYVKRIFDVVDDENFVLMYHNCGNTVEQMLEQLAQMNADIYHFGNSSNLKNILENMPNCVVAGNIDPLLLRKDSETVKREKEKIIAQCGGFDNFIFSTGCDIPPDANIDSLIELCK
ncbi:MAG TPA: methyltransferase [Clostridiales bacterium]|nr:methyltransferase [Clostridiales bacterium]